MKRIIISAFCLVVGAASALAQNTWNAAQAAEEAAKEMSKKPETPMVEKKERPNYWTRSAEFTLGFNQTGLINWAAGGYNTASLAAGFDGKINYKKNLVSWNNRLQMQYGFFYSDDKKGLLQKSADRLYFESVWARETNPKSKWSFTASYDFRTQFSNNFENYVQGDDGMWSGTLKSGFLSPAYTNLALGMEWKPLNWFNVNIAPLTGGFTICTIDSLRKDYGMLQNEDGSYQSAVFQMGTQIKVNAKAAVNDVFVVESQLVLFTDYLNKPFVYNRVNWDNKISWRISRFFKLGLDTWLLYDPIVTINDVTSRVQFKEFFTVNFIYLISNKK